jgi:hypothetical protein
MATEINDHIQVIAVFDNGIRPAKFKWKGRTYPVKEITYTWGSKDGAASLVHFSVTDGETLFELVYNASAMKWSLERTE